MEEQTAQQQKPEFQTPLKKKSGFGKKLLVVLLVLLLLAGAGYAGYTYARNQTQKDADAKVAELQSKIVGLNAAKELSEKIADDSIPDPLQGKLKITEWAVQLDSTKSSMSYKIIKDKDGSEVAWLTNTDAQSLKKVAEDETCNKDQEDGSPNHWYLAVVIRTKTKFTSKYYKSRNPVKLGSYYYYADAANGTCAKQESQGLEAKAHAELFESAQTVKALE